MALRGVLIKGVIIFLVLFSIMETQEIKVVEAPQDKVSQEDLGYNIYWIKPYVGEFNELPETTLTPKETLDRSTLTGGFLVSDAQNPRVLGGRFKEFIGLKVSRPGYDVRTSNYTGELLFNSDDIDDWKNFDPANFSYSSATRINVANYTPSQFFQIGDKLRFTQTTTKYAYVIAVGSTYIDITGGSDYSVANATITEISTSRLANPENFPAEFNYTHTLSNEDGASIGFIGDGGAFSRFSMIGRKVIMSVIVDSADLPASTQSVRLTTPFKFIETTPGSYFLYTRAFNNSTYNSVYASYLSSAIVTPRIDIYKEDLSDFTAGQFNAEFTFLFNL